MALKIVNTESLDAVADAINAKAGTSGKLQFPDGFVSAVEGISAGGGGGDGYDVATMQKFVDARGIQFLYSYSYYNNTNNSGLPVTNDDLKWLAKVDLSNWDSAYYMFYSCESSKWDAIPLFDTSHITNMTYMFTGASASQRRKNSIFIPDFDTSNATTMQCMFQCRKLKNFPNLNYSNVTVVSYMFNESAFDTPPEIPNLDFPNVAGNINSLFRTANIAKVGNINAPKVKEVYQSFYQCRKLQSVGNIDLNGGEGSWYQAFYYCDTLTTIGSINARPTNIYGIFSNCAVLDGVSLDLRSCTTASDAFSSCKALTNLTLKNIKVNLQVGSRTYYGHLLTVDSLVGLCYELRDTGSVKTLTIGSANLEKLASVYVRSIEITDAMRAEDDLIDEKLPFERCDSTDEGATLIGDYVLLKNWKLA